MELLEEDDGSGWVKIADSEGGKGLVPASYVELSEGGTEGGDTETILTPISAPSQGCGTYGKSAKPYRYCGTIVEYTPVRAIYTYDAQGADELSLHEGDAIELSAGPKGGQNYADGWWEGFDTTGRKGIFPSNYVGCCRI